MALSDHQTILLYNAQLNVFPDPPPINPYSAETSAVLLAHQTKEYCHIALLLAPIICADGDPDPYSHGQVEPPPLGIVNV